MPVAALAESARSERARGQLETDSWEVLIRSMSAPPAARIVSFKIGPDILTFFSIAVQKRSKRYCSIKRPVKQKDAYDVLLLW